MAKYRLEYHRDACIGAAVCAAAAPENFVMNATDGKADLVNAKQEGDLWVYEFDSEEELEKLKQAAEGCPVLIIKILENGNQIAP